MFVALGVSRGGPCTNRFVLKHDVAIASEAPISSKNFLAMTDFLVKRTQLVNYCQKPPSSKPPHSRFPMNDRIRRAFHEQGLRCPNSYRFQIQAASDLKSQRIESLRCQLRFRPSVAQIYHRPLNGPFERGRFPPWRRTRKLPISANGAFPLLNGPFSDLNGPFSSSKSPGKQSTKKRGIKRFLNFEAIFLRCCWRSAISNRGDLKSLRFRFAAWASKNRERANHALVIVLQSRPILRLRNAFENGFWSLKIGLD